MTSLLLAILSLAWIYGFYPGNRIELVNPLGRPHRAFTENCGFVDVSILLRASDWPWTFGKPPILESLAAEAGDAGTWVHWSRDGSVLAVRKQGRSDPHPLFSAAYDYKDHELTKLWDKSLYDPTECDRRITELLERRGGVGLAETGIDDGKYSDYSPSKFPAWGWVTPVAIIGLGGLASRRILRWKG